MASEKNISTSMALIDLTDKISTSFENNEYTIGVILDLAKAFDTVNHSYCLTNSAIMVFVAFHFNGFKTISATDCNMFISIIPILISYQ